MGVSCCKNKNERNDDIDSCENISDIRDYVSIKIENAQIEIEEINLYLQDKKKYPKQLMSPDIMKKM